MAGRLRITDRDKGYKRLFEAVRAMRGARLTVGVHAEEGGAAEGSLTVAEVGAIHEFGAPAAGIPRRSFLRGYLDEHQDEAVDLLTRAARAVVTRGVEPEQALELVGASMVGEIQGRISAGIDPPNAPSTIARKGSSTPLISTGQLRSSITHKVVT